MGRPTLARTFAELADTYTAIFDELLRISRRLDELEGTPVLVSKAEFARLATCSVDTVTKAIETGDIHAVRLGPRTVRIPVAQLYQRPPPPPPADVVELHTIDAGSDDTSTDIEEHAESA